MSTASPSAEGLPAAVDLRPRLEGWGIPARSQAPRPTCSVFAVVGGLEYALAARTHRGTTLSVEFLNWSANRTRDEVRDGGFFHELWHGYEQLGICAEELMPYQSAWSAETQPSEAALDDARSKRDAGLRLHWIKEWDIETGLTDAHLESIKATLAAGCPVLGGMRWPHKPERVDGVLQMVPADEVFDGHSVLLTGYRDDPAQPGGGVFTIRDSGGGGPWAALPYAYVQAYMNDAAWVE